MGILNSFGMSEAGRKVSKLERTTTADIIRRSRSKYGGYSSPEPLEIGERADSDTDSIVVLHAAIELMRREGWDTAAADLFIGAMMLLTLGRSKNAASYMFEQVMSIAGPPDEMATYDELVASAQGLGVGPVVPSAQGSTPPAVTQKSPEPASAWHPDPTGRYEYRYWDGRAWTDHVSVQGQAGVDPIAGSPPTNR